MGLESRDIHEEPDIQANHHHNRTSAPRIALAWHYFDHTLGSSQKRGVVCYLNLGFLVEQASNQNTSAADIHPLATSAMGLKKQYRRLSIIIQNWRLARNHDPSAKSLPHLPNKVLIHIAEHLDPGDIKSLLVVNRRLSFALTTQYQFWAVEKLGITHWDDSSGLHWAAAKGHEGLVRLLLDRGFCVDMRASTHGTTALHYSAMNGHESVVRLLLERGAIVDVRDHVFKETASPEDTRRIGNRLVNLHGMTPLHYAAVMGQKDVVRLLLDAGASIEERDLVNLRTVLILATFCNQLGVVKLLLERGADIGAVDRDGWRARSYAESSGMSGGPDGHNNRAAPLLQAAERIRDKKLRKNKTNRQPMGPPSSRGGGGSEGDLERVRGYCSSSYQRGVGEFLCLGQGPVMGAPAT